MSLLDAYQTVTQGSGLDETEEEIPLSGRSWFDIANAEDDPDRIVFSEYHATHSPTGAYMVRRRNYKFIYYVGYPPELFDLAKDPEEERNLAGDEQYVDVLKEYESLLRSIVDPEQTDRRAKDDQNALIEKFGGRDKALDTGTPGATPVPV